MKNESRKNWFALPAVVIAALVLAGCENEEQAKQLKELQQELDDRTTDVEELRVRLGELEQENGKLRDQAAEAGRKAADLESKLKRADSDLAALRQAKEAEAKRVENKSPREKLEQGKKAAQQGLAAVVSIEGDVSKGHGFAVEADGKTWLYVPASVISGNAKLTVKAADGELITKFGAFQLAPDRDLARLEIVQPVAGKLQLDPGAGPVVGAMLLVTTKGTDAGMLQLSECRVANAGAGVIEADAYHVEGSPGCPVFDGESGKLVAMVARGLSNRVDLWGVAADALQPERPKFARLDAATAWSDAPIGVFLAERRKIDEVLRVTRLVKALVAVHPTPAGVNLDVSLEGGISARQVLEENKSLSAAQELLKLEALMSGEKAKPPPSEIARKIDIICRDIDSASRRLGEELAKMTFTPFHRAAAEECRKWRQEAAEELSEAMSTWGK